MDASKLCGDWKAVTLPHAFLPQRIEAAIRDNSTMPPTVVDWYRLPVPPQQAAAEPLYLYIPRWKSDGQLAVYGDGRLLYQSHASMSWNGWNIPLRIALDATANAMPPSYILLRVERPRFSGGGISSVWLGEESTLKWRYRLRSFLQVELPFMSSAAFLAVGLFSLFVWLRLRDETPYLLFFLVSATAFLRGIHFYVGTERLPIADEWFSWLTVNSLFWMMGIVHFFLNHVHRHPIAWLNRVVVFVLLTTGIGTLPFLSTLPNVYTLAALTYVVLLALGTTVSVLSLRISLASRSRDGILLAGWGLLGMGFGVHDWLLQNNYVDIEWIYLGPYSNIFVFVIFTYIMFHRYVGAIDEVKRANVTLAERLQAREIELTETHRALREIAQQQALEEERKRLMQDMHDGLGSSLVSALRVVEHGKLDDAAIAQVLKSCIDDLKLTIDSLEPVEADLLLLLATLRFRLAPRLEASSIALHWEVQDVPALRWLTPRHSLHILRILQEAFTNVIKHAHATKICVATATEEKFVVVTIADNGQGFDFAQAANGGGKGLANQARRAEAIGGRLDWNSSREGTQLSLRLPL